MAHKRTRGEFEVFNLPEKVLFRAEKLKTKNSTVRSYPHSYAS